MYFKFFKLHSWAKRSTDSRRRLNHRLSDRKRSFSLPHSICGRLNGGLLWKGTTFMYRFQLPEDFLIGTANSAFQSEGAWDRDGKSESIMDHFARKYAGKLSPAEQRKLDAGRSPDQVRPNSLEMPDRGCFFYDNYEAYIEDMQKTGQNTYRMSLSWPRILPDGVGAVNQLAIDHYNRVIDKLLSCGITPFVDLYHWDLPMCLFEQGGFLNPEFPAWFENYARVCFTAFGDRCGKVLSDICMLF